MIVLDTSVLVDALLPRLERRHEAALSLIQILSEKEALIYGPRILLVELACVLSRYKGAQLVQEMVSSIAGTINLIDEAVIFEEALSIAMRIHPRAVDAYFIAAAKLTNSTLISNDRVMVENARKEGVDAYFFIEEVDVVLNKVRQL